MDQLVSARIQSVLKNLVGESNTEVDFDPKLNIENFDEEAYKSLKLIVLYPNSAFAMQANKRAEIKLLDIDFAIPSNSEAEEHFKRLQDELKKVIECKRIAKTYGYAVLVGANTILILYFSSHNDFERFNELVKEYTELSKSLNNVLWEEIQYIKYLVNKDENEIIKHHVLAYYGSIHIILRMYIRPVVNSEQVIIYAPVQIKGRLIGKQGNNVKRLQEEIRRKVIVKGDIELTKLYLEKVQLHFDEVKLIDDIIEEMRELESLGVPPEGVIKLFPELHLENVQIEEARIISDVIEKLKKLKELEIPPESVLELYRSKYPKEEQ